MLCQQAKPRGGVATEPSDDEVRVVTAAGPSRFGKSACRNYASVYPAGYEDLVSRFCELLKQNLHKVYAKISKERSDY